MIERPIAERDPIFALYAEQMAKELKVAPVRPLTTVQAASTQAILDRPKELDEQWQNRPLPESTIKEAQALKAAFDSGDPQLISKLTNQRDLDPKEVLLIEAIRRRPKNTTGDYKYASASKERIEAAENAYLFSPGVKFSDLSASEKETIKRLSGYQPPSQPDIEEKKPNREKKWTVLKKSARSLGMLPLADTERLDD